MDRKSIDDEVECDKALARWAKSTLDYIDRLFFTKGYSFYGTSQYSLEHLQALRN
ncbi:MAG: hypothetical protein KKF56_02800 [Nanoarchaeota archaeon]|nr:hypothetical protein [Nanoarchaeota archaeon]